MTTSHMLPLIKKESSTSDFQTVSTSPWEAVIVLIPLLVNSTPSLTILDISFTQHNRPINCGVQDHS
jgi:hypothetical protein